MPKPEEPQRDEILAAHLAIDVRLRRLRLRRTTEVVAARRDHPARQLLEGRPVERLGLGQRDERPRSEEVVEPAGLVRHGGVDGLRAPQRSAVQPVDRDRQWDALLLPGDTAARRDQREARLHGQPRRDDVHVGPADRPERSWTDLLIGQHLRGPGRRNRRRGVRAPEAEGLVEVEVVQERLDGQPSVDRDRPRPVDDSVEPDPAERQPEDLDLEAGADVRVRVERRELHDRVDRDEPVRAAASGGDAGLEVAAELHRVRRDGEVALGADVDPRHRAVEVEAEPAERRDRRGLGPEAGVEAT